MAEFENIRYAHSTIFFLGIKVVTDGLQIDAFNIFAFHMEGLVKLQTVVDLALQRLVSLI